MSAYYNENEPYAADWLENLIREGHIAPGVVDRRSILDVRPDDLQGFVQHHFFAGLGGWSYALRHAGWPDDRPAFSGSCPCQPFSAAGKGNGFADERHVWPYWFHLIAECQPSVVFGEQVASKDGLNWLDLVHSDMEGAGYAFGAQDRCSAGVGGPHRRQRIYFVARRIEGLDHHHHQRSQRQSRYDRRTSGRAIESGSIATSSLFDRLAHGDDAEWRAGVTRGHISDRPQARWDESAGDAERYRGVGGLAHGEIGGWREKRADGAGRFGRNRAEGLATRFGTSSTDMRPGPVNGPWRNADWLFCRDGKWRPVESGTFPLAHGTPARVGRLRAYGNAIDAENARDWIETYLDFETLNEPVRTLPDDLFSDLLG